MSIVHFNQDCFLVLFFQNILAIRLLLYQNNNSGNKKTLLSRISFYLFLIVCFDSLGINTSPCLHQEKLHFFGRTPLPTTETSNFFFWNPPFQNNLLSFHLVSQGLGIELVCSFIQIPSDQLLSHHSKNSDKIFQLPYES